MTKRQPMKVLALFPYPVFPLVQEIRSGQAPDTFLMGLNRLGDGVQVDWLDPVISPATDFIWHFTRFGPIGERFFAANLIQQIHGIERFADYDALVIRDLKNIFLPALFRTILRSNIFTLLLNPILDGTGKYDFMLAPFLRRFDMVCHDTRAMASVLARILHGASRLWYLPYGVDTEFFAPAPRQEQSGIISVGVTNRDYPTLIRAAKELGIPCKIFASRVLPLPGRPLIDLRSIPSSVGRVSAVNSQELKSEYERAEVIVLPLNETPTASGVTSLLEAMAMGKAVVVARTSGLSDYVDEGTTALAYRTNDHIDLAMKVKLLLANRELREELGRNARARVTESFSTKVAAFRVREYLRIQLGL